MRCCQGELAHNTSARGDRTGGGVGLGEGLSLAMLIKIIHHEFNMD